MALNTLVLPPGISWPVKRSLTFKTARLESISGRRTRLPFRSVPRWNWDIPVEFLRSAQYRTAGYTELETLVGFFVSQTVSGQAFLYRDTDDFTVTNQPFGLGDGVSTTFGLVRTYGGFTEPVYNVASFVGVYVNGVPATYTVNSRSQIIFAVAPVLNASLMWSGIYNWVCSFDEDMLDVGRSAPGLSAIQSLKFSNEISV